MIASLQINLDRTNVTRNDENNVTFQHDCLYVATPVMKKNDPRQIIAYCMSEWPSKWNIQNSNVDQKFTFEELHKQSITSRQLYLWSAPMDIVEDYQSYLDQLSTSNKKYLASEFFYNCTPPRFGSLCQYEFDDYESDHLSLNEFLHDFYLYKYESTAMTCYHHLQCNRGPAPSCLDWSEVCDGKIDCLDGGQDEEQCWQLEINECEENEYRCINGQCISNIFFRDNPDVFECLDGSDEISHSYDKRNQCDISQPALVCEDVTCTMNQGPSDGKMPLTSSCDRQRNNLLIKAMFLNKPVNISNECWSILMCFVHVSKLGINQLCTHCQNKECDKIIAKTCPDIFYIPAVPILFGHVYFAYTKNNSQYSSIFIPKPNYVCYNKQICPEIKSDNSLVLVNNVTCATPSNLRVNFYTGARNWITAFVIPAYNLFSKCVSSLSNDSAYCVGSNMYQCINSRKCISRHRLLDSATDCYDSDDEQLTLNYNNCSSELFAKHFKCKTTNECIPYRFVNDGKCDCTRYGDDFCDDEPSIMRSVRMDVSFATICDGFIELFPITIDGQEETDETNCEYWLCNNTYTRCDGFWNCLNGADEIDCNPSSLFHCPLHHHLCVSAYTTQWICLPIEKANDRKIDCLGAIDEPRLCRAKNHTASDGNFYCKNDKDDVCLNPEALCDYQSDCMNGDDYRACNKTRDEILYGSVRLEKSASIHMDLEHFFGERSIDTKKQQIVYFSLEQDDNLINYTLTYPSNPVLLRSTKTRSTRQRQRNCHRGLDLRVWIDKEKNLANTICLCPPSFYGDKCQYQNQRVSLTMQIQALSDAWQIPFVFIVSLIDNDDKRTIHSYEQFTYLLVRDCQIKFNLYLLYSTRPKLASKHYSVHIDIYEKISLTYRGSWLITVPFQFLPVQRLAFQLNIPRSGATAGTKNCSNQQCVHGQCIGYFDNPLGKTFCQCNEGWSGADCTIPHVCMCSSDSLCIGFSVDNRSICICPIEKLGSRCLLNNPICRVDQNATCYNGGQCIPNDEHMVSEKKFTCICPRGFTGERCEIADTKIIVSFHKNIALSPSMLVHFIEIVKDAQPKNASTFKTIPIAQNSVTIYWSHPFHIVFIELFTRIYYLTVVQKTYNQSATIIKKMNPSDRCENLSEILDESIVKLHLLRRIKYYHVPCQRRSPPLSCFYDDDHFCLCRDFGEQRVANCFQFDHHIKRDCFGQSACENGAQCFQDNQICGQTSMCACPTCFYGTRCQFNTNGFSLSLDTILGYHILPNVSLRHQSYTLKITIALSILMTIMGLINGILSIITFKNKKLREVGCGIYLLGSSIATLLTMIIFTLKFWILIYTQMFVIVNKSFLDVQCFSLDFLLKVCLNMEQWLNASVAIERAFTVRKGVNFNKKKSTKIAKWTICILLFVTIVTAIHDPIYRRIIDDINGDQKRLWCAVSYTPAIQTYNLTVNVFHLLTPFLINIISALIIITANAQQRTTVRVHKSYTQLLREQLRLHNRVLIAPFILVILACPRLIISFVSGCMKSTSESWLFLTGYFVSYIPPMLTFGLFVLPSKLYKNEVRNSIEHFRKIIRSFFVHSRTRLVNIRK